MVGKRGPRTQAFMDAVEKAMDRGDTSTVAIMFYALTMTGHADEMVDFMPQKLYEASIKLLLHERVQV